MRKVDESVSGAVHYTEGCGGIDIYNYAAALIRDKEARPKKYWANTSGNGIIREFAGRDDFDVTDKFETLMNGGTIVQKISDELTYDSLHENDSGDLPGLRLRVGGLHVKQKAVIVAVAGGTAAACRRTARQIGTKKCTFYKEE